MVDRKKLVLLGIKICR